MNTCMAVESRSGKKLIKFFLLIVILVLCWYLGRIFKIDVGYYQELLSRYPLALSGLIFVLLYVLTTTFVWLGPKDVLRISSAVLFGGAVSAVFVWAGEMFNAGIMFHLSRFLGREYVQQKFRVKPQDLDRMKDDATLLSVAAWRINPLVPFRFIDLGYGLTQISFRKYLIGIAAVSFVRILWLQLILAGIGTSLFQDPSSMIAYFAGHPHVLRYSGLYFLFVLILTVIAFAARFFRKRADQSGEAMAESFNS